MGQEPRELANSETGILIMGAELSANSETGIEEQSTLRLIPALNHCYTHREASLRLIPCCTHTGRHIAVCTPLYTHREAYSRVYHIIHTGRHIAGYTTWVYTQGGI